MPWTLRPVPCLLLTFGLGLSCEEVVADEDPSQLLAELLSIPGAVAPTLQGFWFPGATPSPGAGLSSLARAQVQA